MTKKIYANNAEACRAYRERKRLREALEKQQKFDKDVAEGKIFDMTKFEELEEAKHDYVITKNELPHVEQPPQGNTLCFLNEMCLKDGYVCKLGEKYKQCKFYILHTPKELRELPRTSQTFYTDSDRKPYGNVNWGGPVNTNSYRH